MKCGSYQAPSPVPLLLAACGTRLSPAAHSSRSHSLAGTVLHLRLVEENDGVAAFSSHWQRWRALLQPAVRSAVLVLIIHHQPDWLPVSKWCACHLGSLPRNVQVT